MSFLAIFSKHNISVNTHMSLGNSVRSDTQQAFFSVLRGMDKGPRVLHDKNQHKSTSSQVLSVYVSGVPWTCPLQVNLLQVNLCFPQCHEDILLFLLAVL